MKNNFSFPFLSCPQTLSGSYVLTFAGTWAVPPWAAAPSSGSSAPPAVSSTPHAPPSPYCPEKLRSLRSQTCGMTVTIRCLWKAIKTWEEKNVRQEFSAIILFCVSVLTSNIKLNLIGCFYLVIIIPAPSGKSICNAILMVRLSNEIHCDSRADEEFKSNATV